jgi:hypothetical protein
MALPITIPNTFANATTSIPLANLDANFTTVVNAINGIGNGSEALVSVNITGGNAVFTTANATTSTITNISSSNVTITGGVFSNTVANNTNRELVTIDANGAANTINFDVKTSQVLLYTGNASANVTINIRGNSDTTLNNTISNNESVTVAFGMTNNATARYVSLTQIDGSNVTPKWQGGAPTGGTANSTEVYVYNIVKTGTNTYTVLASKTAFT